MKTTHTRFRIFRSSAFSLQAFRLFTLALLLAAVPALSANAQPSPTPIQLFNGKDLSGWTIYGANTDVVKTLSVKGGAIGSTGGAGAYIRTNERYSNYRLSIEWRWHNAPLRDDGTPRVRGSGILLHLHGRDMIWPASLEAEILHDRGGELILNGGVTTNEHTAARAAAIAAAGGNAGARKKAEGLVALFRKKPSSEKPVGRWNRYDIVCEGDTVTISVNGVEQNRVTGVSVQEGHIGIQTGGPMEFRNITLTPLK